MGHYYAEMFPNGPDKPDFEALRQHSMKRKMKKQSGTLKACRIDGMINGNAKDLKEDIINDTISLA